MLPSIKKHYITLLHQNPELIITFLHVSPISAGPIVSDLAMVKDKSELNVQTDLFNNILYIEIKSKLECGHWVLRHLNFEINVPQMCTETETHTSHCAKICKTVCKVNSTLHLSYEVPYSCLPIFMIYEGHYNKIQSLSLAPNLYVNYNLQNLVTVEECFSVPSNES